MGHRLHEAVAQRIEILLLLTMAPATRRMAERGGAINLGEAWQFCRWVRLRPDDVRRYLLQRLGHRPLLRGIARFGCDVLRFHRIFAPLANAAIGIRTTGLRRPATQREIAEIDRFGPEIDQMWQSIGSKYDAVSVRDSQYLNWRLVDCPDLKYRRFVVRTNDLAVGYCVLRRPEPFELRVGVITDIFAAPHDEATLSSILDFAIRYFGATWPRSIA